MNLLFSPSSYVAYGPLHHGALYVFLLCSSGLFFLGHHPLTHRIVQSFICLSSLTALLISCLLYQFLPLQICHVSVWLVLPPALWFNHQAFRLVLICLSGWCAMMALILPDLATHAIWIKFIIYYLMHCNICLAALYVFIYQRPTINLKAIGTVFICFNVFLAFVGMIDYIFSKNYVYLAHAPAIAKSLSFAWAWPWYIVQSQFIILLLAIVTWCLSGSARLWSYFMHKMQNLFRKYFYLMATFKQ